MHKLYILLPVHNRKEVTRNFIQCLSKQTFRDYHLLLIDDGSSDGTAEMVREAIRSLTILKGRGNWWWAGSLQQGINWLKNNKISDETIILLINDDVEFDEEYLQNAEFEMKKNPGSIILSKFLSSSGDVAIETGISFSFNPLSFKVASSGEQINCLSTRGLFLHWRDIKKIGNFHTILLPHYGSDYEYTIRAFRKGIACKTSNQLLIKPNLDTTGIRDTGKVHIKDIFSKKCASNPLYISVLIFLVCPLRYVPINLLRTWLHIIKHVAI